MLKHILLLFIFVFSNHSLAEEPKTFGILLSNGTPLSLKWRLTENWMILPSLFTVLSNDIQSNTLDLGLATRYYFNNSKFQHFAQIGNVHALKIDTINLEPKAGYAFRNISTRYGIERLLSNHVSIEGAIEFVANFESTRITYRYPFWRLGMSYFW